MRNDEFMTGRAHIHLGIVENQILQMNEFAGNPHAGDGFEEIGPLYKARPGLRAGHTLVETRQRVLCGFYFGLSIGQMSLDC